MKKKSFIRSTLLFFILLLWFGLGGLLVPMKSNLVPLLPRGVVILDNVSIEIAIDKENDINVDVFRITPLNNESKIRRNDSKKNDFNELKFDTELRYVSSLKMVLDKRSFQSLRDIDIVIGNEIITASEETLYNYFDVSSDRNNVTLTLKNDTKFYSKSMLPYIDTVINYRGDLFFILVTALLSIVCTIFIGMYYKKLASYFARLGDLNTILVFFSILMVRHSLVYLIEKEIFLLLFDFLFIILIYHMLSRFMNFKTSNSIGQMNSFDKIEIHKLTIVIIISSILFLSLFFLILSNTWLDDGKYFLRGFWYVNNELQPYGPTDGNNYAPIFFYLIGYWQLILKGIFSNSLISVRLLSTVLLYCNYILVFFIIKKTTESDFYSYLSLVFFTLVPFSLFYSNTATPYTFITFITLVSFIVLFYQNKMNWQICSILIGIGCLILIFSRRNMILGIPFLLLFQILGSQEKKIYRTIISISVITVGSIAILSMFPGKLTYNMVSLPYIKTIVQEMGIIENPFFTLSKQITNASLVTNSGESPINTGFYSVIWTHYLEYYIIFIFFSILSIVVLAKKKLNNNILLYASIYFVFVSLAHALGRPGSGSVTAYIQYVSFFGVIGSISGLRHVTYIVHSNKLRFQFLIIFTVVLFLFWAPNVYTQVAEYEKSASKVIDDLSKDIEVCIPSEEKVLVIDTKDYIGIKAVHFAGLIPEYNSHNLHTTYRQLTTQINDIIIKELEGKGVWTDELMIHWINNVYNYILVLDGDPYAEYFSLQINLTHQKIKEIHLSSGETYYLYQRTDKS